MARSTIKDIRSSEKVLYRQVLDLYATSIDYDASNEETLCPNLEVGSDRPVRVMKLKKNALYSAMLSHADPSQVAGLARFFKAALEAFLQPRYRTMPRTMLRYAIEKFTPEERKNLFFS